MNYTKTPGTKKFFKEPGLPHRTYHFWISIFLAVLCFLFSGENLLADKTDIVILQNGDRITGEIKELKFGKLKYSTDDAGTIYFEWDKVAYLKTVNQYQIELEDGSIHFGSLDTDSLAHKLFVLSPTDTFAVDLPLVVWIIRVKDRFWSRIGASISLGFSYTKASDIGQLSFSSNANYRTRKHFLNFDLSSIFTSQPEKETSRNNDFTLSYSRTMRDHWVLGGKTGFQSNTELGLDLRYLLSAFGGNYVVKTNFTQLVVAGGLNLNQEWQAGAEEGQSNLEGLAAIVFQTYRYDSPQLKLLANITGYPNLTPVGRFRIQGNIQLRWEVFSDFFWDLTFYDNFDNEPAEAASKNDYGVVVSVGWSY